MNAFSLPSASRDGLKFCFAIAACCFVDASTSAEEQPDVRSDLSAVTLKLEGRDGKPLARAKVTYGPADLAGAEDRTTIETGRDGQAELRYDETRGLRAEVFRAGYLPTVIRTDPMPLPKTWEWQMTRGTTVRGRIVEEDTNRPIEGAKVRVRGSAEILMIENEGSTRGSTTAALEVPIDERGEWAFPYASQRQGAAIFAVATIPFEDETITLPQYTVHAASAKSRPHLYRVPAIATKAVFVRDAAGNPIEGATVWSLPNSESRFGIGTSNHIERFTNEAGRVNIPTFRSAPQLTVAFKTGYGPALTWVKQSSTATPETLILPPETTFTLRIETEDGRPLTHGSVLSRLERIDGNADEDPLSEDERNLLRAVRDRVESELGPIGGGDWRRLLEENRRTGEMPLPTVNAPVQEINPAGLYLEGYDVEPEQESYADKRDAWQRVHDGRWTLSPVPIGPLTGSIHGSGFIESFEFVISPDEIGRPIERTVVVKQPPQCRLTGRVVDAKTGQAIDSRVTFRADRSSPGWKSTGNTLKSLIEDDGSFDVLVPIRWGLVIVQAEAEGYRTATVHRAEQPGEVSDLDIRLEPIE